MNKSSKQQVSEEKRETALHLAILKQMVTLSTSGFGLVAALAWNSVVQEVVTQYIKPYLPAGSSFLSLLIYAMIITVLAVIVTYQLGKLVQRIERLNDELERLKEETRAKKTVH
jgi:uncharacterized membrane protein (DUF106 family)